MKNNRIHIIDVRRDEVDIRKLVAALLAMARAKQTAIGAGPVALPDQTSEADGE
jgi:hypothetical protein